MRATLRFMHLPVLLLGLFIFLAEASAFANTSPPVINIWYGHDQSFGNNGISQAWVNILGNVSDSSGIAALSYRLNSGLQVSLSIGPDGKRLQSAGDFNIDIAYSALSCGANTVDISATDTSSDVTTETVNVFYYCNTYWPRTYSIDWGTVTNIQDVAQIVDGSWTLEGSGIRPVIKGYDRLIAIGDIDPTWKDYEVTVPITLNTPLNSSVPHGPLFGIVMHWKGHYDWDGSQPRWGWYPLGAMGIYDWVSQNNDYRLRILGNAENSIAEDLSGRHLAVGVPYIFKMRAETVSNKSVYSLKVWEADTPEPSGWNLRGQGISAGLKQGSLLLLSHYSDVSFGNVSITPGPFLDDVTPPVISNVLITTDTTIAGTDNPLDEAPKIVTGVPRFSKQVIDTTMDETHFAATGDFDSDGDTDVIATDYVDDTVAWYENIGGGGFTKRIIDANLEGAYPVFVTDFNRDGALDVLAAGYLADLAVWYENNGSGGFSRRIIDADADGAHSLYPTDLDDDGDTDLVGANQDGNSIVWYENDGSTTFIEHPPIDVAALGAKSVFADDLDGDNDIDIAVASFHDDTIAWYENDGNQNFNKKSIDTAADGAYFVLGTDLDRDGDTDLLATSQNDDTVASYVNNGYGGFTWHPIDTFANGARSVFAADVDGDGDTDVLAASVDDDTIAWYRNNGGGGFTRKVIDGAADGAYGVFASNVNGDGQMDVVIASRDDNTIALYYQTKAHYASLDQGGVLTIGRNLLEASDVDNAPAELIYTITSLPVFGELQLNGVPLAPGGTFTQADIDNNRIEYVHNGANTVNDIIAFTLTDGGQYVVKPGSGTFTLNITDPLAPVIRSDDFSAGSLASYWSFAGPVGTSSNFVTAGNEAFLQLIVPSGNYDLWGTNRGARMMQDAPNGDFEVEAKFLSQPATAFQIQGILIEQDADNWMRFDTVHNGTNLRVFVAVTVDGVSRMKFDKVIEADAAPYLRMTRMGDDWTLEYSADGATWIRTCRLTHTLNVKKVGPFAGSTGGSPGYTAQVDYFFNTAAQIVPEYDGVNNNFSGQVDEGLATPGTNNPPIKLNLAEPANGATGVPATVTLKWGIYTDAAGDPVTYKLHIGIDPGFEDVTPIIVAAASNNNDPAMAMRYSLGMFGLFGIIAIGRLSKTGRKTGLLIIPIIMVTGVIFTSCGSNGTGSGNGTPEPDVNKGYKSYTVNLQPNTTYYWKVVAENGKESVAESDTFNFITGQ